MALVRSRRKASSKRSGALGSDEEPEPTHSLGHAPSESTATTELTTEESVKAPPPGKKIANILRRIFMLRLGWKIFVCLASSRVKGSARCKPLLQGVSVPRID